MLHVQTGWEIVDQLLLHRDVARLYEGRNNRNFEECENSEEELNISIFQNLTHTYALLA